MVGSFCMNVGSSQVSPLIAGLDPAAPPQVPTWVMPPACAEMGAATRPVPTSAEVRNKAGLSDILNAPCHEGRVNDRSHRFMFRAIQAGRYRDKAVPKRDARVRAQDGTRKSMVNAARMPEWHE